MSKTIIVTGASGNLGIAVTSHLLKEGYRVVATVASEEAKKDLPQSDNLHAEAVDLSSEEDTAAFVQRTIQQHTQIHAALLLVGGFAAGNIEAASGADIKKQISLNFDTAYHVTRPVFQHMKSKGQGRIVFIGARPALEPAAGKELVAYGLSKSLLFKLAEYLNAEAKGCNVTATVVVPSTLDTALNLLFPTKHCR
jgi:NAD(P)-dependent dehydrogenase (short-subunit alcohol dehydrogenase family)